MLLVECEKRFEEARQSVEKIKTDLERINKEIRKLDETLKDKVSKLINEKFDKEFN